MSLGFCQSVDNVRPSRVEERQVRIVISEFIEP